MAHRDKNDPDRWNPEPRWLAWVEVLAVGGIYTALPSHLIVGPRWAFLVLIIAILIPTMISHHQRYHRLDRALGFAGTWLVTVGMIASVALLISGLPEHREAPTELLLSAVALWTT